MASRHVVIPTTLSDRSPLVHNLIREARQVAEVVVVHTTETDEVKGTTTVRAHDTGLHFSRWINLGLDQCDGPTLQLNDDLLISAESMTAMLDTVKRYDLTVLPKHGGVTPISGWCMAIDPNIIRHDESYQWWYSDDDIWERATREKLAIGLIDVPVVHSRGNHPKYPLHLAQKVMADRARFAGLWRGGNTRGLPQ